MKTKKLRLVHIKFTDGGRGLMVVDEENKILSGGGFSNNEDATTASRLIGTLLARLDLTDKEPPATPPIDLEAFMKQLEGLEQREAKAQL